MHTHTHTYTRARAPCTNRGSYTGGCLALRGIPPPAALMESIRVTPAGPPPRNSAGRPWPRQAVALLQESQTPPLTFLSAHSRGAWGVDARVWASVSLRLCLQGSDVCVCVSETVCEPVGCGTGRVCVPGLPTETDPAGHMPLLPCPTWGGGRLRAQWAGEAQPGSQGGPPGSLPGGGGLTFGFSRAWRRRAVTQGGPE